MGFDKGKVIELFLIVILLIIVIKLLELLIVILNWFLGGRLLDERIWLKVSVMILEIVIVFNSVGVLVELVVCVIGVVKLGIYKVKFVVLER